MWTGTGKERDTQELPRKIVGRNIDPNRKGTQRNLQSEIEIEEGVGSIGRSPTLLYIVTMPPKAT